MRYTLAPLGGAADRPEGTYEGRDRLREEIRARLAEGPVRFDLRVTVAAPGDDPDDPMSVWKGARELSAGVVEVTAEDPARETDGDIVVFDPTRVVDGITLSDDPILRYRAAAYSESAARRAAGPHLAAPRAWTAESSSGRWPTESGLVVRTARPFAPSHRRISPHSTVERRSVG